MLQFLPFGICATICFYLAESIPVSSGNGDASASMKMLIITTIVGFLTMIAQQLFAAYKSSKQHEWDVDERNFRAQQASQELKEKAELLRRQTEGAARMLADKTDLSNDELRSAIAGQAEKRAMSLAAETTHHAAVLGDKIDNNTKVTSSAKEAATEAYLEASALNKRILELQEINTVILKKLEQLEKDKVLSQPEKDKA